MNENYQAAMNAPIQRDLPITMHGDEIEEMTAPLIGFFGALGIVVGCFAVAMILVTLL